MNRLLLLSCVFLLSCGNNESESLKKENENLKVQIADLNQQVKDLKNELHNCIYGNPNQDIQQLGRWKDIRPGADIVITIFKNTKTNKLYIKNEFKDGSSTTDEARTLDFNGLKRYEILDNKNNEYYVLEKNGDLSLYGQSGKYGTAPCF